MMLSQAVFSQQKNVTRSNQSWIQYYQQMKLSNRLTLMTDGGFRWSNGERLLYIARTGLGYQLASNLRVAAGIASTGGYDATGLSSFELRPYQEIFTSSHGKIGIQQRFRIEERFFRDVVRGEFQNGHNFNFRFRYQISASIPLIKFSNENNYPQILLSISDEIFVNAGREIAYNFLDKNRLVIGPALQVNKNVNIGIAYNFQFSQLNAPASYAHDDVLWLTVRHQLDLSQKNND